MPATQNIKVAVNAVVFGYTSKEGLSAQSNDEFVEVRSLAGLICEVL